MSAKIGLKAMRSVGALMLLASAAQAAEPVKRAAVEAVLPAFETLVQQSIDRGEVPGLSVAIVAEDQVVYLKGFGVREIGKPETVNADTVFQIASLSKPLSATVVAAAIGDRGISWDSKITDLDPAFHLSAAYPTAELTLTDLFSHRSGLPGGAGNELEDLGFDRAAILQKLALVPLDGFRSHYSYSNFGLTEGGEAVAKAEGKDWADLAAEKLYKPLGMTATSSRHADFLAATDRATLHIGGAGAWHVGPMRQPDAQAPAGGISSTAADLAKWLRLELDDGRFDGQPVVNAEALAATHVPLMERGRNPVTGGASFYGRGWNVEFGRYGLQWGHAGAFSNGARTLVTILPEQKLGIVILANAFPTGLPEGLSDSLLDLVFTGKIGQDWIAAWDATYSGLFGPAVEAAKARYAHPPAAPSPALAPSAYVGRYANAYLGTAIVSEENGALVVALGPTGERRFPLAHFDRDIFLMHPAAEMPDLAASATFTIGPDGKADRLTLETFDDLGFGTLKRAE